MKSAQQWFDELPKLSFLGEKVPDARGCVITPEQIRAIQSDAVAYGYCRAMDDAASAMRDLASEWQASS